MTGIGARGTAPTRSAVEGAIRAELDALGDRLAEWRQAASSELERLAALRWVTDLAGIRTNEVAERAGVSRQTLANLRTDERGSDYGWPSDLRVLLHLGLSGAQSSDELLEAIAQVPVGQHQVTSAIERLADAGLIAERARVVSAIGAPTRLWHLTAAGVEDLPRRLRHAAMPQSRTWTAYVASTPAEANAIAAAGESALGEHGTVVIPAGTVHGMSWPEVAFRVEAADGRAAQAEAISLFRRLRARAGMTERQNPIVVTALIAPTRSAVD